MAPKQPNQGFSAAGASAPEPGDEREADGGQSRAEAEIKAFGMSVKIPLPKWAVTAIAGVIVAGLAGAGWFYGSTNLMNRVAVPRELLSTYKEADKHSREPQEQREENVFTFPDTTRVTVVHHRSDGCDQIVRWIESKQKGESLWIFGPGLTPEKQAAASPLDLVTRASIVPGLPSFAVGQGPGKCLDSHPGRFREQSQAVDRCTTKVFRYFDDGCSHYQLYNACSGTWDAWPNGAPRVYWERCVHR